MPYFDNWGWYTETVLPGRYTDVPAPTNIPDGYAANWTGHAWIVIPYSPPPVPFVDATKFLTQLAFRNRFTQAEKIAIEIAALDNPADLMEQRAAAAALRSNQKDVDAAEYIDLDDDRTISGVQQLEAAGLLATGRADEILGAPVLSSERFVRS